ncbi:MAG: hypothetical protein RLZZ292_173 [Bacteroidota bacterium]|jgi:hypothetical protein
MRTHTLKANDVKELTFHLDNLFNKNETFNLAIVFCAPVHDIKQMLHLFDAHQIDVFGCTTAGEILNNELLDGAITVMLFDVAKDSYAIHLEKNTETILETAVNTARMAKSCFTHPALIVLSGGVTTDGEEIVQGIKAIIPNSNIPIFGGLAGDDLAMRKTVVFTSKEICNDGLLTLIFDNNKVEVEGIAASGWQAIGATNVVTHALGNILYSINGEPALDVFTRYFGTHDNAGYGKEVTTISAQYPLQIARRNDYSVMRAPIIANSEDGSLWLAGGVKNGDEFRFSMAPGFETMENTVVELGRMQKQTNPAALILFSCVGRRAAFGPMLEDEIGSIYESWNQTPMIGFLTYGEIGNLRNEQCDFHNETCCLVSIRERA